MMQCSSKQKTFLKEILVELNGLVTTNDINSPSHSHLIDDFCERMMENYSLTEAQRIELNHAISLILIITRQI